MEKNLDNNGNVLNSMASRKFFYMGILSGILFALIPAYVLVRLVAPELLEWVLPLTELSEGGISALGGSKEADPEVDRSLSKDGSAIQHSLHTNTRDYLRIAAQLNLGKARYQAALRREKSQANPPTVRTDKDPDEIKKELERLYEKRNIVLQRLDQLWEELGQLRGLPPLPGERAPSYATFSNFLRRPDPVGYVDWRDHWVYAIGESHLPDENLAREIALHIAKDYLSMTLHELWVDSETPLAQLAAKNEAAGPRLAALAENVGVVEGWYGEDGAFRLLTRFPLHGRNSVSTALAPLQLNRLSRLPTLKPPISSTREIADTVYSGLIIDARGLAVAPGLFPRIVSRSQRTVYDLSLINPNVLANRGLCVYVSTPTVLRAYPYVGKNPLIVAASESIGTYPMDLLVEDQAAQVILAEDARSNFLEEARVAILIDTESPGPDPQLTNP